MTVLSKILPCTASAFKWWRQLPDGKKIVWGSFGLIAVELLLLLVVNPVFYPDSSEYLAALEAFRLDNMELAFPPHLPVFYTLLAGGLNKLHIPPDRALVLVNGLFTALTVFPLYGLLKKMLPEKYAGWGCLLFALTPAVIRCGTAPLTDSGRFFFVTAALYLIFTMPETQIVWRKLFALGAVYGMLALVRAEGVCLAAVTMLIHGIILLRAGFRNRNHNIRDWVKMAVILIFPLLLMLLFCAPRMYQMYNRTGYPCLDSRQLRPVQRLFNLPEEPVPQPLQIPRPPQQEEVFEIYYWKNLFSSFNYVYLPFTMLGILYLTGRKKLTFNSLLMLLLMVIYSAVHYMMRAGIKRYLLMNMVFLFPFTITGFQLFFAALKQKNEKLFRAAKAAAIGGAGVSIIMSMNNLTDKYAGTFRNVRPFFQPGGTYSGTENSRCRRPVVLLAGLDYGVGYYCNVNVITYTAYPFNLEMTRTVEDILKNGVDRKYISHCVDKNLPEILYFDTVIADNNGKFYIDRQVMPLLELEKKYDGLYFYKVKPLGEVACK